MLAGVRRSTVIAACLAVVLSGAVVYALMRGSDAAPAPARAKAEPQLTFPAHIRALPPEVRARLYAQASEKAKAERRKAGKSVETERTPSRKHTVEQAERDPGIGGLTGGTPAPRGGGSPRPGAAPGGGTSPRPVVAPTPVPTVVPSTTPTPSVSVPAGTTVGTAIDLITAAT